VGKAILAVKAACKLPKKTTVPVRVGPKARKTATPKAKGLTKQNFVDTQKSVGKNSKLVGKLKIKAFFQKGKKYNVFVRFISTRSIF
jgi:hypothetical protein